MMRGNVVVIGAGTAGLIAAKRLGSHGINTVVYDQKKILGQPVRASGILSITGLSTLGIDYSSCITNTLYGANLHAGGKVMKITSKEPVAHILDRKKLNWRCRDEAVGAGALVITGKRMASKDLDAMSSEGVLIGADGAVSTVARHFGLGEIKSIALTYKADFNINVPDRRMVDLFFDRGRYRGLFAWLAPNAEDILEVGVGIDSKHGNAKNAFEHFMKTEEIHNIVGDAKPVSEGASIIPMRLRERIVDEERRVMLMGDAAGQVKPTTGGGIIFGGNAAIMAADIIKGYFDGTARLADYEAAFKKKYGLDMKLHTLANRIYSSSSPKSMGTMLRVMNALGADSFLGSYGDMDRPSLILKRLFFRGLDR
ncbi:NAD(P)/FAD-dependent oxidoreductase [Candidatus Marsarchaeota archaeon]|nr:NAD(P)/FAD-dependent oxidoreductase [Candidatus Marsarchaeota archaeon]